MQGQARPIIEHGSATLDHGGFSLQVALLANGIAKLRGQVPGVDDGVVRVLRYDALLSAGHVQRSRSVAALAADRMLPKQRRLVLVGAVFDRFGVVAVAMNTTRQDFAIEMQP